MSSVFQQLAKLTGGDILGELDNCKFFIDTGSLATNYVCSGRFIGGGIPGQRMTEIFGPSASGKSYIASNILKGCQDVGGWPIMLDVENASNAEWMEKSSHLDTSRVFRYTPLTLERAFNKIHNVTRTIREYEAKHNLPRKPIVVSYDSISASPCERELKEINLPEDYTATQFKKIVGGKEQPGERARVCSAELRKLQPILQKEDVTVIFINQVRDAISLYGPSETTAGGGRSLRFYASCVIRTQQKKKIEHQRLKSFSGINLQVKNVKNRAFRPFVCHEGIRLYFDSGLNPLTGLLTALIEDERIVPSGRGSYMINDGSEESPKFRSSMERNDVPMEFLLEHPELIDASSAEEVADYLKNYQDAIEATNGGAYVEKPLSSDDDDDDDDEDEEEDDDLV